MSTTPQIERHPIELTEIELLHLELIHRHADPESIDEETAKVIGADIVVELEPNGDRLVDEILEIVLDVRVGMVATIAPLGFALRVLGRFSVPAKPENFENVLRWARANGFFLLIPFVREIVYSVTKYAPSGPYIIPLLAMPDNYNSEKDQTNS